MLKQSLLLFSLLFIGVSSAQKVTDRVLNESCDCFNESTVEHITYDSYMELVVNCTSYRILKEKDALGEELGIKTDGSDMGMQRIGEEIGKRLAMKCPKFMEITMKAMGESDELSNMVLENMEDRSYEDEIYEDDFLLEEGKVTAVSSTIPCMISIETNGGEVLQFMWLNDIGLEEKYVEEPSKLKGQRVNVVYYFDQLYDPKAGNYLDKKMIIELTLDK